MLLGGLGVSVPFGGRSRAITRRYIYPSTWATDKLTEFCSLTGAFMTATAAVTKTPYSTVNVIGDACVGGSYHPGCKGLDSPNMSSLEPLLARDEVDGIFWYTFGAGYGAIPRHHFNLCCHAILSYTLPRVHRVTCSA